MEGSRADGSLQLPERIGVRAVFGLAWPVMVAMLSHTVMTVADTIFVGQLGTAPLAGVGLAGVTAFMVLSFGAGLLKGVRIEVSQRIGAGDLERARALAPQTLWLAAGLGLIAMAIAPLGSLVFGLLSSDVDVVDHASVYFGIRLLGAPLFFAIWGLQAWFRGRGDTRTPMVASVGANLLNVALDAVFVLVLDLGVAGAALATVIAEGSGAAWIVWRAHLALSDGASPNWRPSRSLLSAVVRVGAPLGVHWQLEVAAFVVFAGLLASVGAVDLAAHVIVLRICSLSFLPGHAIGEAAGVLTGQSIGAKRYELVGQAHRAALRLALGVMVGWAVVFVLAPGPLIAVFGAEPEVAALARRLLLVAAAFQLFDAIAMVSQATISSTGDTRFVMLTGALAGWAIKLPLGWLLAVPLGMGAVGAWLGLSAEIAVVAAASFARCARCAPEALNRARARA